MIDYFSNDQIDEMITEVLPEVLLSKLSFRQALEFISASNPLYERKLMIDKSKLPFDASWFETQLKEIVALLKKEATGSNELRLQQHAVELFDVMSTFVKFYHYLNIKVTQNEIFPLLQKIVRDNKMDMLTYIKPFVEKLNPSLQEKLINSLPNSNKNISFIKNFSFSNKNVSYIENSSLYEDLSQVLDNMFTLSIR